MKSTAAVMTLLGLAAVGCSVAYQAAARERDYRLHLRTGDMARRDDQTFTAIQEYSGAIALRPDSMLAHLRRGETYHQRGELDAAALDFRIASSLDPSAPRPLEELGDVRYQQERFDAAAEAFENRLRLDDRSPEVTYKLALARYRNHDLDAALAALADALRMNAQRADAHYVRGLVLREKAQPAAAREAFERALALSPAMIPAREELADLYGEAGRQADEIEQLELIAGLDRQHIERHVAVGLAHARAGHADLAVLALDGALERNPNQPLIYSALGDLWLEMTATRTDAMAKALPALVRAAATPNASSHVLTAYGRALLKDNQVDLAERILQKATERFPVDPSAFLQYAAAAERQNHLDAARNALVTYGALVADDREFADHALRVATLSLRLHDPDTAALWAKRAAAAGPMDPHQLAALANVQLKVGAHPKHPSAGLDPGDLSDHRRKN